MRFETIRVIALCLVSIWVFYQVIYVNPKKFLEQKSFFEFNNISLSYKYFGELKHDNNISNIDINNIENVQRCVVSELQERFGRFHKLSAWQLYRKSSIGVHIGKAVIWFRYLISYIFFIFPYKIWRLRQLGEPLSMLNKNLVIRFKNRNYLLINIYKQEEYEKLKNYFALHGIGLDESTAFIPHLQGQGWFIPKEEIWTNEFNQGEEK